MTSDSGDDSDKRQGDAEPYAKVAPATDEELARLAQDWRVWERPEVRQWLATGKWPDEGEGEGEGDTGERGETTGDE